ncbi:protein jim lovell [Phymastichus coffea]|uniref:protein jim lovell n=1 Tax=Phymastichus coffea TaxID=108790 RepID=UPI00273AC83E|nr:protein jim lovell [Phymastichus coffea]XP_058804022.1 protein jim lovell [Phymastichus coffea]XP_058804023.1 protein jim lovell [Phymastichus coffea]XP_058804024.1 protein jim lovell [Phymastichus coffea]
MSRSSSPSVMALQSHYSLRWNNHQSHILQAFEGLLQEEVLVDVTLVCSEASLKAHKVVLGVCSPFFERIFTEHPCKHPIIVLKDFTAREIGALIEFMYRGEVRVERDELAGLMRAAECLQIRGLASVEPRPASTPSTPCTLVEEPETPECQPATTGELADEDEDMPINSTPIYVRPRQDATVGAHRLRHIRQHQAQLPPGFRAHEECESPLPRRKQARPRRRSGDLPQDLSSRNQPRASLSPPSAGLNLSNSSHRESPSSSRSRSRQHSQERSPSSHSSHQRHQSDQLHQQQQQQQQQQLHHHHHHHHHHPPQQHHHHHQHVQRQQPHQHQLQQHQHQLQQQHQHHQQLQQLQQQSRATPRPHRHNNQHHSGDEAENLSMKREPKLSHSPAGSLVKSESEAASSPRGSPLVGSQSSLQREAHFADLQAAALPAMAALSLAPSQHHSSEYLASLGQFAAQWLPGHPNHLPPRHPRDDSPHPSNAHKPGGAAASFAFGQSPSESPLAGRSAFPIDGITGPLGAGLFPHGSAIDLHEPFKPETFHGLFVGAGMSHPNPGKKPKRSRGEGMAARRWSDHPRGPSACRPKGQHSAPRGGPPRSWTNGDLTEALTMVWNKKMTTSQASRVYGIPYNSLLMYVRGKYGKSLKLEQLRRDCTGEGMNSLNNNVKPPLDPAHMGAGTSDGGLETQTFAPHPVMPGGIPQNYYPEYPNYPVPVNMVHLLAPSEQANGPPPSPGDQHMQQQQQQRPRSRSQPQRPRSQPQRPRSQPQQQPIQQQPMQLSKSRSPSPTPEAPPPPMQNGTD